MFTRRIPLEIRFWKFVSKSDDPSGCWIWIGYRDARGYGRFSVSTGRDRLSHRVSWMLFSGKMPRRLLLHRCDNPACVRPDHLFEGTQADNVRDMDQKGRRVNSTQRGEKQWHSKLTSDIVLAIRHDVANGMMQTVAAKKYGMSKSGLHSIVKRKTWNHV